MALAIVGLLESMMTTNIVMVVTVAVVVATHNLAYGNAADATAATPDQTSADQSSR